jgi:ankyrin repeat protein
VDRVRELLQFQGVDVRHHEQMYWRGDPKTALVVACERGHVEVARLLLDHGGVTKEELEGALCVAAREGRVETLKMLMERGADPSVHENWAVCWSAYNGHTDVVKLLLQDMRVNPADRNNFAVDRAARNGHCDVLEVLLAILALMGLALFPVLVLVLFKSFSRMSAVESTSTEVFSCVGTRKRWSDMTIL